ncbi:hypothetical protein [Rathayibacter sp. SD072]|uniref:hypothetical protein n=1 Tax=Rathayibacter sp. SD072 TaxID=2781731 RepID=UPI001A96C572|nr:hypothetical protein [Rathayibacter sp. SD072]MBO0983438.1 hypothetical protein [Rathayibacter sp. SD072]
MGLREDAEELVRAHRRAAERAERTDPWSDPETPEWCGELTAALWQGSYRPSPVYYRAEDLSHAWRGPHPVRLNHLGFGWQITARRMHEGALASSTAVVLETGSLWLGLGPGRRPHRGLLALADSESVEGLQPGHDHYFAVRRFPDADEEQAAERRLLFGVAGLAALIEDAVAIGPQGELEWTV